MSHFTISKPRKGLLITSIALLISLLLSACGGDPRTQEQALQKKADLDKAIKNAQTIGIPAAMLKPILDQENSLAKTRAPLTLFSSQPAVDYNTNLAQRYHLLALQVQGLQAQATQQFDYQASQDIQTFGTLLSQRQAQKIPVPKTFSDTLVQNRNLLAQAQYPKQYLQISQSSKAAITALRLMGPATDKLNQLQTVMKQLHDSHVDVTAIELQSQYDTTQFANASSASDYTNLINLITAQLDETTTLSTQAIPYVGAAKLNEFSADLTLMKQYGTDITPYQKRLDADRAALDQANQTNSISAFLKASSQIDSDVSSIQFPLLKARASYLLDQYHQEVKHWGDTHQYVDKYDGNSYRMGYEYDENGVASDLDYALQTAVTADDYQAAIDFINSTMTNLKAMEADTTDPTPFNLAHQTDLQLLQYYKVMNKQVIVVSLVEQALRLYQNGQVVHSFQVTTGQYAKPSVPGFWNIMDRESPTKFKSSEPKGSAFWYPDTNINFAMLYHAGGYFLHDSWWRVNYGPGTEFPHYDTGGDESFAGNGSHGCVNMPEDQAGWLYNNTSYNTLVIIY